MSRLDTRRDFELKPFESLAQGTHRIDPNVFKETYIKSGYNDKSLTAAEIKALCCAGVIDEKISVNLYISHYRYNPEPGDDNVYYFLQQAKEGLGYATFFMIPDLKNNIKEKIIMDIYGHGQYIGALVTCYAKKNRISIDDLMNEIRKNPSTFINGISDGIGVNRENGRNTNNGILEDMKL